MSNNHLDRRQTDSKLKKMSEGNTRVRALVIAADFAIVNILLAVMLYGGFVTVPAFFDSATKVCVMVVNFAMVVAQYFFHTIIDRRILTWKSILWNVVRLVACHCVLAAITLRFLAHGRGDIFTFMAIFTAAEFAVITLSRFLERTLIKGMRKRGLNTRNVLFVGSDPSLAGLYRTFAQTPAGGYVVRGYYADRRMTDEPKGLMWLGDIATMNRRLERWNENVMEEPDIDELFCSLSHSEEEEIRLIMHACDRNVIHFFYVPRTFGNERLRLKAVMLGDRLIYSNRIEPLLMPGNRLEKRVFDICFSSVVCLFLIPITLVVGLIIKLQSPGPIFFKQLRTGLDGKDFYCYKFRSMHVNKDADTAQATKDDPRKFPFGNFMRKANIDELPQFFNVLKGDMSIVGPRPHMLHHTELYGRLIDNYMVRLFCKPGITGWAQVTGYRGETKELWQMEERVKRDIWYVEHWSLWLDIRIIVKTFTTFFVHDKNAF